MLPILLALQVCYGIRYHKIHCNRYSVLSVLLLFVLALPLLLFVLVNQGLLPEIALPWITIPKTQGYRGGEIAFSLSSVYANFKNTAHLLLLQDTGSPYDFLLPWGLFYDIGRVFILIGIGCMLFVLCGSMCFAGNSSCLPSWWEVESPRCWSPPGCIRSMISISRLSYARHTVSGNVPAS